MNRLKRTKYELIFFYNPPCIFALIEMVKKQDEPSKIRYTLNVSPNYVVTVIELVKSKILEWSILLEENGIDGNNISFTTEEKAKVKENPQSIHYTTNIYGSVTDSQLQQGTTNSEQIMK